MIPNCFDIYKILIGLSSNESSKYFQPFPFLQSKYVHSSISHQMSSNINTMWRIEKFQYWNIIFCIKKTHIIEHERKTWLNFVIFHLQRNPMILQTDDSSIICSKRAGSSICLLPLKSFWVGKDFGAEILDVHDSDEVLGCDWFWCLSSRNECFLSHSCLWALLSLCDNSAWFWTLALCRHVNMMTTLDPCSTQIKVTNTWTLNRRERFPIPRNLKTIKNPKTAKWERDTRTAFNGIFKSSFWCSVSSWITWLFSMFGSDWL